MMSKDLGVSDQQSEPAQIATDDAQAAPAPVASIENRIQANQPYTRARVRDRTRSGLRPFDLSTILLPGEAKHDRIKLHLTARIGYSSADEFRDYLQHVCDQSGTDTPLFRHQAGRTPHTCTLTVARGWLFSGEGRLFNIAVPTGATATLDLTLDVNPTRFLAHTDVGTPFDQLSDLPPEVALARSQQHEAAARAAALDEKDNLLLGTWRQGGQWFHHRQGWWSGLVHLYLEHILTLLRSRLEPAHDNSLPPVRITPLEFDSVTQVECYWEQETTRAHTLVALLAERLRAASGQLRLRHHLPEVGTVEEAHDRNCQSVTFPLSREVQFCIYAKTLDRVRFEIRYLSDVRGNAARGMRGGTDAFAVLEAARVDAARRMTRITETLAAMLAPASFDRRHLMAFMRELLRACEGDHDQADALMEALVNAGGVSETAATGVARKTVVRRLERRGVLRQVRVRARAVPRFVLAPPYSALRRGLLSILPEQRALAEEGLGAND
jgi:hypothetical protein